MSEATLEYSVFLLLLSINIVIEECIIISSLL